MICAYAYMHICICCRLDITLRFLYGFPRIDTELEHILIAGLKQIKLGLLCKFQLPSYVRRSPDS